MQSENSKKLKIPFLVGMDAAPRSKAPEIRERICKELGRKGKPCSNVTFYKKQKGVVPLKKGEKEKIESVFADYGINPWTGERIGL